MNGIKKVIFLGASVLCLSAAAGETMVYDLRVRDNFIIGNQFSVDKDEEPWLWATYNVGGEDMSGPEQYNSSYTDGYYSSAFYTPELSLAAGTYKVYTKPRKKNSDYTVSKNPNLYILIGQGDMTESAYNAGKMTEVGHISDISYASLYSEDAFNALPVREIEFTITTPGKYHIAFFNKDASVTLHNTYIVAVGEGGVVEPDPDDPVVDPDDPNVDPDDPVVDPDDPNVDPDDPGEDPTPGPVEPEPLEEIDLPFADSFESGTFAGKWQVESNGGKGDWNVVSVVLPGQFLGNWAPVDDDGGMACYDGWTGNEGDFSRLVSAPISKASSSAPVVDFWFRHSHSRGCKNYIKLQVSADGGDWQDVADSQIFTYIPTLDDGGWEYYKFALSPYIDGCESYRVAFTGYNDGISTYLPIDNVNIYNMASTDLRVENVVIPEVAVAGKGVEIDVVLTNMGGVTINPDDYTISADTDLAGEVVFEKVAIPSLETAVIKGRIAVNAEDVLNGSDYSVSVSVNVPGNASGENFVSDTREVEVSFVAHKAPENPRAERDEEGVLSLSWDSVKELDHANININESFNDLDAHHQETVVTEDGKTEDVWVDGAKGNFNGFVSLDLDKQDGGTYYSTSGSEFQVFKDFMTGSMPQGHSGQYIGLTLPGNIQQDDWLISPELNAAETGSIDFHARIAYIHRESDSYNNSLEVLYSTEDYSKTNPSASFKRSLYSNVSKASSGDLPHDGLYHWLRIYDIPSEAKYVALHFNTKSGMQTGVWIDRLIITEKDQYPLVGYNVYRRGFGILNEAPLTPTELAYTVKEVKSYEADMYYVTALYEDGESAPSELVGNTVGVNAIVDGAVRITAADGVIRVSGADGETATVYSLDGKKIASTLCDGTTAIALQPGIYVVKVGSSVVKVLL